jgi:hypothetical protein
VSTLLDRQVAASLAQDLARKGELIRFVTHGGSMAPSIPSGSEVTVVPCTLEEVRPGWVVMVRSPQGMLVHRAVDASNGRLVLWGDAMPAPDGPLDSFEMIGHVVGVTPTTLGSRIRRKLAAITRRLRPARR